MKKHYINLSTIKPSDKEEVYLKSIALNESLPSDLQPSSTKEVYLEYIAKNGSTGGGGGSVSPAIIEQINNNSNAVSELKIEYDSIKKTISNKVDKVTGKGLSKNDYTDTDKQNVITSNESIGDMTKLHTLSNKTLVGAINEINSTCGGGTYIKYTSDNGSITAKNTLDGEIRNLKILGNTTGGYNPELSTSFPLQSVGQAEGNKISILSRNKNLSGNVIDGAWDISNGNFLPDVKGICNDEFIKLNKGNYVFTKQKGTCWFVDSALHSFEITTNNLNIPNDGLYKWYILGEDLNKNVQLEQGTIPSSYSPPQQDKKDILLPFEGGLKKINNVSDIIYEGSIIQKIGSNILDGRLTYDIGDSSGDYVRFNINEASLGIKNGTVNLLCDKLNFVDRNTLFTGNMEGISVYLVSSGPTYMFAKILKSRLNGNITSEGIKKYFDSNIHKFNYELATPITHEIPSQKLSTFKPLTTLSVESEVEAGIEGEFPSVIVEVVSSLIHENEIQTFKSNALIEENKKLKLENQLQQIDINANLLATTEIFEIVIATNMIPTKQGGIKMIQVYATLILKGLKTIEEVPIIIRDDVKKLLEELTK